MDDQSLIGDGKTVIEMISDQVPKLIGDQFDRPSNVHGKTGPKSPRSLDQTSPDLFCLTQEKSP